MNAVIRPAGTDEYDEVACVCENERAWRWCERERFVYERHQVEPMTGFVTKDYRWKRGNKT
jgi:hypothetical protein